MLYILLLLICWIAIYLLDSVIHPLHNRALVYNDDKMQSLVTVGRLAL